MQLNTNSDGVGILTLDEFSKFFQFHAFEILSEKIDILHDKKDVPYKRFVQMHREIPWAQDILNCVSKVCRIKNSYKKLMADLHRRNMHQLHAVCMQVATSNTLPCKYSQALQKCCITGKWYEGCLDISKASTGNVGHHSSINNFLYSTYNNTQPVGLQSISYPSSIPASPASSHSSTLGIRSDMQDLKLENDFHDKFYDKFHEELHCEEFHCEEFSDELQSHTRCDHNMDNERDNEKDGGEMKKKRKGRKQKRVNVKLEDIPELDMPENMASSVASGKSTNEKQKKRKSSVIVNSNMIQNSSKMAKGGNSIGGGHGNMQQQNKMFISNHFQHFVHMLWTMSKLDIIIKNFTLSWFSTTSKKVNLKKMNNKSKGTVSKSNLLSRFCKESSMFQEHLYKIFLHAVDHVTLSLSDHLEDSLFVAASSVTNDEVTNDEVTNDEVTGEVMIHSMDELPGLPAEIPNELVSNLQTFQSALMSLHKSKLSGSVTLLENNQGALLKQPCKRIKASTLIEDKDKGSNPVTEPATLFCNNID